MKRYLAKRILFSVFSLLVVLAAVMLLIYSLIDRSAVIATDGTLNKYSGNEYTLRVYTIYQDYGYLEYTHYGTWIGSKYRKIYGEEYTEKEDYIAAKNALRNVDTYATFPDVIEFTNEFKAKGYEVEYLPRVIQEYTKKQVSPAYLVAKKEKSVFERLGNYLANFFKIETIWDVQDSDFTDRYIRWEWDSRSNMPALVGSGTTHKYLIYFDDQFPYVHQNIFHINLGVSNTGTNKGNDVMAIMKMGTGEVNVIEQEYPIDIGTGVTHASSLDFHTVRYTSVPATGYDATIYGEGEHYTVASQYKSGTIRIGNSFLIGILATIIAYIIGFPLGILMAAKKDKFADKFLNIYIIFIMAVPSLAYIYIFAAIGTKAFGLPYNFSLAMNENKAWIFAAALPIISLAMPSIGGIMKWMRRFMIDQRNSDYVKFARSQGLSEGEIFSQHISRNAFIFFVHGIPADILFALVGALITERVYQVPGVGGLLTNAISGHDNGTIVAGTVFYTFLTILAMLLGDLLLAKYDPRVSFTNGRK